MVKRQSIFTKFTTPNNPSPVANLIEPLDSEEEKIRQTIENERAMADMNNLLLKKEASHIIMMKKKKLTQTNK
jgi:hypothetical protein